MEVSCIAKNLRVSPQKCRLVADQIRGLPVGVALEILKFSNKKSALMVKRALNSAISNAEENEGADIDELRISRISVDEGTTLKRMRARAKGRGSRIFKRTSHLNVTVSDDEVDSE